MVPLIAAQTVGFGGGFGGWILRGRAAAALLALRAASEGDEARTENVGNKRAVQKTARPYSLQQFNEKDDRHSNLSDIEYQDDFHRNFSVSVGSGALSLELALGKLAYRCAQVVESASLRPRALDVAPAKRKRPSNHLGGR
jgi:hypothetical protein